MCCCCDIKHLYTLSAVVLVEGIASYYRRAVESSVSSRLLDLVFQFGPEAWIPATEGILPVLIQHARPDLQHGLRGVDGELTGE
jgi:hypothetical protein